LKEYKVRNILWTGVIRDTPEYKEWQNLIKEEGAKIYIAEKGEKVLMSNGILMDILYPFEKLEGKEIQDSNDTSVVSRLTIGYSSFLFTGDITKLTEKEIIDKVIYVDSDVLKIAHHGSKTSSSEGFLEAVSPEVAIISVGKNNSYGHPAPEVLENLNKYGIKVLRTDELGDIKIISDGQVFKIE
jgi:competence protein ComEC